MDTKPTYDLLLYDAYTGEFVERIPSIAENVLKLRCNSLAAAGFNVKVVSCDDGAVVSTWDSMEY